MSGRYRPHERISDSMGGWENIVRPIFLFFLFVFWKKRETNTYILLLFNNRQHRLDFGCRDERREGGYSVNRGREKGRKGNVEKVCVSAEFMQDREKHLT